MLLQLTEYPFSWLNNIYIYSYIYTYVYFSPFINLFIDDSLGCFNILFIVNNVAINMCVQISLGDTDISAFSYIPSGIAESYGSSILNFYWNKAKCLSFCVVYESFCVTIIKLNSCDKYDMAHKHKMSTNWPS